MKPKDGDSGSTGRGEFGRREERVTPELRAALPEPDEGLIEDRYQRGEADEQENGAADAKLGRRPVQTHERPPYPAQPLGP